MVTEVLEEFSCTQSSILLLKSISHHIDCMILTVVELISLNHFYTHTCRYHKTAMTLNSCPEECIKTLHWNLHWNLYIIVSTQDLTTEPMTAHGYVMKLWQNELEEHA